MATPTAMATEPRTEQELELEPEQARPTLTAMAMAPRTEPVQEQPVRTAPPTEPATNSFPNLQNALPSIYGRQGIFHFMNVLMLLSAAPP